MVNGKDAEWLRLGQEVIDRGNDYRAAMKRLMDYIVDASRNGTQDINESQVRPTTREDSE